MAAADSQWPLFYQGLQQLAQHNNSPEGAIDIEVALQHSEQLALLFIELAQHNPATVIAQLNLTPRQLPLSLARLLKILALGLIFARGYGWQAQRSQQFLQAIILPSAFEQQAASPQQAQLLSARTLQNLNKQHPLLPLLIALCNVRQQAPWQLHPDGPLLTLVSQLAAQLLPTAGTQLSLEQLLQQYRSGQANIMQANWFCLLQQFAELKALPGRFGKEQQASTNSQNYWFISGVAATPQQPVLVYARQFDPVSKTMASEVQQLPLADLKVLTPQYFRDPAWLEFLEVATDCLPAPVVFSLEACLAQSQYNLLATLSLSAQVQQLESQPLLNQFLQQAAQQISRQQLPVNRLRHAISMLGQDALSDWVAQAELHQYCHRLAHPHQAWLEQLQNCLQHALLLLSDATKRSLAVSTAGVIARCASLSIWQQPALTNIALGRHAQGQLLLGQLVQQHIWQATNYPTQLSQLFSHYQQPDWAKATLSWHQQQQTALSLLLRLSWQLSLAVFCASEPNQQRFDALLSVASAQLGLPAQAAEYWQQQLMASSQCYYPLPVL